MWLYAILRITLITVQWCRDVESQTRGEVSLLGTPEGTVLGTMNDSAVHTTTMKGTP